MADMTTSEWYHELEIVFRDRGDDGYKTSEELSEMLGVSPATVRKRLKPFAREGRLLCKHRREIGNHGYAVHIPSYKILPREDQGDAEAESA